MTEPAKSSEALSAVVLGKAAGAGLAGARSAEFVSSTAVKIDGGALVARVLQCQGVKYLFVVNGGHTWPILASLREHGIKLIHMRHEQSCAYAADGWARSTAMPGFCSVTAGCGQTLQPAPVSRASPAARWCVSPHNIRRPRTGSAHFRRPMVARFAAPSRSSPSGYLTGRRSKSICVRRFAMR